MYSKGELLYEGKAKRVFSVIGNTDLLWLEFKDDLTAFNAEKRGNFEGKGQTNLEIAEILFDELKSKEISTHWVQKISSKDLVVRKLKMIPLEVVIRNVLAGSTAKKFHIEEGQELKEPLFELFYKKDELGDPFINNEQALMLGCVDSEKEILKIKSQALHINQILKSIFERIGIRLVDFKIEFGFSKDGHLCLGDEISPDSCRLWDIKTNEKLDKDRFRRDLGNVKESYEDILNRLKKELS